MSSLHRIFTIALILVGSISVVAQGRFNGTVIEITDGKSFVLETSNGRIKGVLQFIDVPEPEQPMRQMVTDHLRLLISGKAAEFKLISMNPGELTGRLVINGVDISQQMLRDGAAWLLPINISGQTATDFAIYQQTEAIARNERRGLWSINGLQPAWEFRAQKEANLRLIESAKWTARGVRGAVSQYQTNARPGHVSQGKLAAFDTDGWMDVFAGAGTELPGLKTYTDPNKRFTVIYTSAAFVNLAAGKTKQRLECRIAYVLVNLPNGGVEGVYLFGFRTISEDYNFSRRPSRLTITADRSTFALGPASGFRGRAMFGAHEQFFYRVRPAALRKIAFADKVHIRIDGMTGSLEKSPRDLIRQLLGSMQ
jgi:endonuclease YncB( thermonuclease family)